MRKLLLFLIFGIILTSVITAAPPQASSSNSDFDIRTGVADTFIAGENFDFHVHVFNSSTGEPVTNDICCYLR